MRKQKHMFVVFVALALLLCTGLFASDNKPKLTVTDGLGREVGQGNFEQPAVRPVKQLWETEVPFVPRDPERTWWPYTEKIGDYRFTSPRIEDMRDSQINVNGVAIIDIENEGVAIGALPKDLVIESGAQLNKPYGYYLIKIEGRARGDNEVNALRNAGVILGEYLPINTYIAKIPSEKVGEVKSLPFVTYLGDYHPAYKISPEIGLKKVPATELYDASGNLRPWRFDIVLHQGADLKEVIDALSERGIFVKDEDIHINEYDNFITVEMMPEGVLEVSKIPEVKWIDEKPYIMLHASSTSPSTIPMLLQNNWTFTTSTTGWKLWNAGIDGNASGTAQIVAVQDTGLNTNMEHFSENANTGINQPLPSTTHRKVTGYYNSGGDLCVLSYSGADGGHGTWTSQHAVGSISNMTSPQDTTHTPNTYYDNGIARDAKVYFQDIGNSAGNLTGPTSMSGSITNAQTNGAYIQNNSWGTTSPSYDTNASAVDSTLYSNPNMVVTVSAGNSGPGGTGTIGSPSTAKNCINVGGVDAANPTRLYENCSWDGNSACSTADAGSSQGPVSTSNRIKPDICSIFGFTSTVGGENEAGDRPHAMCQTDSTRTVYWDYTNNSGYVGTSFAAPEVAGLAALVRDYFIAGYYPSGTATPANSLTPSGSLVKAVLLASAEPLASTAYPSTSITVNSRFSNQQGYGRVNLPSVLRIGSGAPYIWVKNNVNLAASGTHTYTYTLTGNSRPLRVMLVWYDAAGNTIQKDLDLEVQIGSNTYYGNVMTNNWSVTGGSKDHTNNTEGVFVNTTSLPSSGTVTVRVIGYNNPGGQNYSLVVSGDVFDDATQISLNQSIYNCADTIDVTVQDTNASSVSVTLTSKNSGGTTIDTETFALSGGPPLFTGSITTSGTNSSGVLYVVHGGTVTATYNDTNPTGTYTANATINCQVAADDGGFIIDGGCDNYVSQFDDSYNGPSYNSWVNEYYHSYMDRGEYSTYTFGFVNRTGRDLTDVRVALSFSGTGASYMTVYNSPVDVGSVPNDTLAGAAFQVYTATGTPGLTSVNWDFDITSPADGYTTAYRITQTQILASNDSITRQNYCGNFTGSLGSYYETTLTSIGGVANPWRYVGNTTVRGENRTNGLCYNSSNGAAVAGNSGTSSNFASYAWSYLARRATPVNTGNAPNGQPWYYALKEHAFFGSVEATNNTSGVWGAFYYPEWDNTSNPVADDFYADAPWAVAYYYHTVVDGAYTPTGSWDWETANTGTPDDPAAATPAPNQLLISLGDYPVLATSNSAWAWAHLHADAAWFGISYSARRDIAIDNDMIIYDQFYAVSDTTTCSSQVGQVSLDKWAYYGCPNDTATISVLDGNASSPITVTVVSGATGDSETVTLTGTAPYFSGTLNLSTNSGVGNNNGTLYVGTADTITATYTDTNPSGQTQASANVECPNGDVVYYSNTQVSDNGDNDGWADNNETITMDITIRNNMATDLTNAVVYLFSSDPDIACIIDGQANYGTVTAGTTATNPSSDRFQFQVDPSVDCTNWSAPPTGLFDVVITGDDFYGSTTPQQFSIWLDIDTISPVPMTYTQNFATNPGWLTAATADDDGTCSPAYVNNFHWCANCGNGGAGYGAWVGDNAFGTAGQNYSNSYDSSTLYSPVFTTTGNPALSFDVAYRTEPSYDGAIVQYQVGSGSWTTLGFTTPAQSATTSLDYCSPLAIGVTAWTGTATGTSWTTTNAATVTAAAGQTIQFRWRLGGDSITNGQDYGGYGVDNVTITNIERDWDCEATRNTGLPDNCGGGCTPPSQPVIGTITDNDACAQNGISIPFTSGSPATRHDLYRDSTLVQSNVTSPISYNPGDTSSHSYVIRAINGDDTCYTDSTAVAFTDANNSVGAPTISSVTDADACATSGVVITWGAVSGATGYDLRVDGSTIVTNVTSPYTYTPGDNNSHNYEVRAKNASCTGAWSTAVAGTDANGTPSAITLTASNFDSTCGVQITFTGGAGATQFDLYVDSSLAQANISSGYIYSPGDTNSHNYVVRGINGACYTDSNTSSVADPNCTLPPPEIATGTNYTWTASQTSQTMGWNSESTATGYRVYRGTKAQLPDLMNANADFCTRYDGTDLSLNVTSDDPATIDSTYRVVYYLIVAYNGGGEGPAGNASDNTPRQINTTGNCP